MSKDQEVKKEPAGAKSAQIQVTFDKAETQYASQAVIQGTPEEIFLNFSSGILSGPEEGQFHLPVHTRIVMSYFGAKRLLNSLNQIIAQYEKNFGSIHLEDRQSKIKNETMTTAGFPRITNE